MKRDIIVQSKSQGLQFVSELNKQNASQKKVTARQYYAYKLHNRQDSSSLLHYGGRLFQQYVVDNYIKIESERLNYLKFNQDKLRKELYQGLHDSYKSGITNMLEIETRTILLSSF
ncbi:27868_t:CDS:2, partial [Dentiscutata erythropus]